MSNEVWAEIYDRLARAVSEHRTTLIFVNTRRLAERVTPPPGGAPGRGCGGRPPRQPRARAAAGGRAAPQGGAAAGAGRHRLAGAGHRHRRGRPGVPARFAALDRHPAAARRPLRSPRSAHCRRAGCSRSRRDDLVECTALLDAGAARGPGPHCRSRTQPLDVLAQQIVAEVACREWDEGRALRAVAAAPGPTAISAGRASTLCVRMLAEGFTHPARAARRLSAPRRRATAGCAHGAARDSPRSPLAAPFPITPTTTWCCEPAGTVRRHAQRGLRGREPGRRHLPARQHLVRILQDRAGPRARRGCARPAAEHPVLARRGAGAQRTSCRRRCRAARRDSSVLPAGSISGRSRPRRRYVAR